MYGYAKPFESKKKLAMHGLIVHKGVIVHKLCNETEQSFFQSISVVLMTPITEPKVEEVFFLSSKNQIVETANKTVFL
jgi:hypothetical protein